MIGVTAIVVGEARAGDLVSLPRTGLYRLVPERVQFPDGYQVDYHREPTRWATAIDTDTIAELQLMPSTSPLRLSVGLLSETRSIGDGGTQLRVLFELPF